MNPLIPVMVVLPILCALLLNLLHGRDRTVKALAVAVAIVLPIIPLLAGYGAHYFGATPHYQRILPLHRDCPTP